MQTVQQVGGLISLLHFQGKLFWQLGKARASHQCLVSLALGPDVVPHRTRWEAGKTPDATVPAVTSE
jgi:hypothetical protein